MARKITLSDDQIEALADALGVEPADMAAAVWTANRGATEVEAADDLAEDADTSERSADKAPERRASEVIDDFIRSKAGHPTASDWMRQQVSR